MKKQLLLSVSLLLVFSGFAQEINPNNSEWMHFLEEMVNDDETDDESIANLYDELSQIIDRPYNLATVTKEELEKLPFLSALQIENLLYYLYRYGPPVAIFELKNVEDWDMQTILRLLPFVRVVPVDAGGDAARRASRRSRNEVMLRGNFPLQKSSGYRDSAYLGSPYAASLRYLIDYKNLQFGLIGEKDRGEKGLDYSGFNLNFKQEGLLEAVHFGNYRLSFGQGLVMNTNFSMGKTADAVSVDMKNTGIQRHISTNESQYFSGVAAGLHHKNYRLHLFYSHRNQDATANDSIIYTWKTDGYHQTYADQQKRAAAQTTLYGAHLQRQVGQWMLGVTAVRYDFGGKTLNPNPQGYNLFYLRGKSHANGGFHYSYRSRRMNLSGELALDAAGKAAVVSHLNLRVASFVESVFSVRYYDRSYNALYAKGFGESGRIQNESGYYAGIHLNPFPKCELSAYLDQFFFPWLKYGIDTPSSGKDLVVRLKYDFRRPNLLMELRYRYKEKQADSDRGEHHRWRYSCRYKPHKRWDTALQFDYNRRPTSPTPSRGGSIRGSFSYLPSSGAFRFDGGLLYFRTDDWNSRITLFEKNIPYTFSFPASYGHGMRYYGVLKWKISRPLTLYLKAGSTHYFDRSTIGSGAESILGRNKGDIYCMVQYKF